jgi:hypothetical protein
MTNVREIRRFHMVCGLGGVDVDAAALRGLAA